MTVTSKELRFRCSPDQEEVIADHLLLGYELGMQPDERAWILKHVDRLSPGGKVKKAMLDIENAEWVVTVDM